MNLITCTTIMACVLYGACLKDIKAEGCRARSPFDPRCARLEDEKDQDEYLQDKEEQEKQEEKKENDDKTNQEGE